MSFRIAAGGSAFWPSPPPSPPRAEPTPEREGGDRGVMHDYILANPEVLDEAMKALQAAARGGGEGQAGGGNHQHSRQLFNSPHQMVLGNPEGAITLVEFFDYNCGYCSRALPDMTALIEANPDLRVVMKEFPILSEGSVEAARISVAVKDIAPEQLRRLPRRRCSRAPARRTPPRRSRSPKDLGLDVAALEAAGGEPERRPTTSPKRTSSRRLSASPGRRPTSSATRSSPAPSASTPCRRRSRRCATAAQPCAEPLSRRLPLPLEAVEPYPAAAPRAGAAHEAVPPAVLHLVERPDARHPLLDLAGGRVRRRGRARQPLLPPAERRPPLGDLQRRGGSLAHPAPPGTAGCTTAPTSPRRRTATAAPWEKPHLPNLTGTAVAYRPPGSILAPRSGRR